MPPFLPPLLLAMLLLIIIPIDIRIIYSRKTEVRIEIQPFTLILIIDKDQKSENIQKKESNPKDILHLVGLALSKSRVRLSKLDIPVYSKEEFSFYTNMAYLGASLYPILSYVGLRSKSLTVDDSALEYSHAEIGQEKSTVCVDVTLELRLYTVIYVLTKYFLFKKRRKSHARRNKGAY